MKLSIAITTYNHESYISEALDSIYNQNIKCDFEVIIGNDNSTDRTLKIIEKYIKKYKNIRIINHKKNVGYTINFDKTLKACFGRYIAIFDGDDVMLPTKLEKQIEFLDSHPDFIMIAHRARAFNSKNGKTIRYITPKKKKEFYTIKDLIKYGSIFANSSKLFRRSALPIKGIDYNIKKIADWYITIQIARKGKIKYFKECLLDYRVHENSIMKKIRGDVHFSDIIYILNSISQEFDGKYDYLFNRQLAYAYLIKGIFFVNIGEKKKGRKQFVASIIKDPFYSPSAYFRFFMSFFPNSFTDFLLKN